MVRFKFLIYLMIVAGVYYGGMHYITISDESDLQKDWRIPKIHEILDGVKLFLQALAVATVSITIFFMGKFHDFRRSYVEKLGEFKELIIKINTSSKPKNHILNEIPKKEQYFENKMILQKSDTGLVIGIMLGLMLFTGGLYYDISINSTFGVKENFKIFLNLISLVILFLIHWYHLDYMLSNRQEVYAELVFDIAKIKALIH